MPPAVMKKVNYLLRRFKNVEWSGPAWYRILKKDGDGFPTKVRLEHFKAIHLGDGTSTELDGEELGKILPKVYKKKPELGKCFMGLIHSHHTMGAFFSGTDKEAIYQESSKEGLYFSTVVASEKDKYVTAVGYKDQYGFSQMIEGEVSNLLKEKSEPEWRYEADKIEKKRKEEKKTTWGGHGVGYNLHNYYDRYGQGSMFGAHEPETKIAAVEKDAVKIIGAGVEVSKEQDKVDEQIAEQYNKLESNEITEDEFVKSVREIDPTVEPHWYIDQGWIK